MPFYFNWGWHDGWCGHRHRTISSAKTCLHAGRYGTKPNPPTTQTDPALLACRDWGMTQHPLLRAACTPIYTGNSDRHIRVGAAGDLAAGWSCYFGPGSLWEGENDDRVEPKGANADLQMMSGVAWFKEFAREKEAERLARSP